MVAKFVAAIEPTISNPRLDRYRPTGGSDLDMVVNYFWNMALAESLFCCLGAVEIALRNALHTTLSQHFGTPNWYDHTGLLEPEQAKDIRVAKARIQGRNVPVTAGRVIGELNFGFWVTILSRNYDSRLWRGSHAAPIRQAFPRVPRRLRQRVQLRYNTIRTIRNRAFHHEPIFDDPHLLQHHQDIHFAIHWINPELRLVIDRLDRFQAVYANGRSRVEQELRTHLGIR